MPPWMEMVTCKTAIEASPFSLGHKFEQILHRILFLSCPISYDVVLIATAHIPSISYPSYVVLCYHIDEI
jgi:hypothetical protein